MDEFEQDMRAMLADKAAGIPDGGDPKPALARRVARRRALKMGGVGLLTVCLVAAGVGLAVAAGGSQGGQAPRVVFPPESPTSTTAPSTTTVPTSRTPLTKTTVPTQSTSGAALPITTVGCETENPMGNTIPAPALPADELTNVVPTEDLALYASGAHDYSGTPKYSPELAVLAPKGFRCSAVLATDGSGRLEVFPPGGSSAAAPIWILDDWLPHTTAAGPGCAVFGDDPTIRTFLEKLLPVGSCTVPKGRTVTQLDAHIASFVDTDGTLGAALIVLPPSVSAAGGGSLEVLTCRPGPALSATQCEVIVKDYMSRNT